MGSLTTFALGSLEDVFWNFIQHHSAQFPNITSVNTQQTGFLRERFGSLPLKSSFCKNAVHFPAVLLTLFRFLFWFSGAFAVSGKHNIFSPPCKNRLYILYMSIFPLSQSLLALTYLNLGCTFFYHVRWCQWQQGLLHSEVCPFGFSTSNPAG